MYEKYVRFYATICFYFIFISTKCGENLFAKVETLFAHDEDFEGKWIVSNCLLERLLAEIVLSIKKTRLKN